MIQYSIDARRGVVRIEMAGVVSASDTVEFLERLAEEPELRPGMPQLLDFTQVAAPPTVTDSESVARTFSRLRSRFQGSRCAVIVADPLMYGAIRQFAALAARAGVDVRPFLDRREAEAWLGVASEEPGA